VIQRCRKQTAGKPIPPHPPQVEILPPTDPTDFKVPPELLLIAERFNAGDYRGCVEPIEALFFARRNTFHQGLLQYVVALHQLHLGLVSTPRRLLRQALELLSPYPDWQEGVDLRHLRTHAETLLARLPDEVHSLPEDDIARFWIPPPDLHPKQGPE
jgi:hypothetical protein